ncbi:MAG: hypothetical protein WAL56_04865 [Candidatus Sulfotelmatobacter sp.]
MILPFLAIALLAIVTVYSATVSFRQTSATPSWIFPSTPSRPARIIAIAFVLATLISLAFLLAPTPRLAGRSSHFLIPQGYTGWIHVEFEVPGAAPLPTQAGDYVLKIPADGTLRTSSPEIYSWAHDHYAYYSPQGNRSLPDSGDSAMVWGKLNGETSTPTSKQKYEEFFVGTADQFKNQAKK